MKDQCGSLIIIFLRFLKFIFKVGLCLGVGNRKGRLEAVCPSFGIFLPELFVQVVIKLVIESNNLIASNALLLALKFSFKKYFLYLAKGRTFEFVKNQQ